MKVGDDGSGFLTPGMKEAMEHQRSCPSSAIGEGPCTCGLEYRKQINELKKALETEQTMHRAWRKRAEEAELKNL